MNRAIGWICASRVRQALLLVAVCAAIFLPGLGSTGFSMSEGHRVIPAWEMLDDARSGDAHWMVPRMFETAYLRKPPGMMWAIAASSAVFGETEFAARLPSAIAAMLLVLSVWWFSTRWFGSPWGLAAGLAQALLPVTWPSARSAEIESLHMLTTGVVCLLLVDALIARARWRRLALVIPCVVLMTLVKGPAGVPFVIAVLIAVGVVRPRLGRVALLAVPSAISIAFILSLAIWGVSRSQADRAGGPIVSQGIDDFMWQRDSIGRILLLGPAVLASMLPVSLALLFPWGPDIREEREREPLAQSDRARLTETQLALLLGFGSIAALLLLTGFGISNPRYGLPACALLSPLVAYVGRGAAGAFVNKRPRIARTMLALPTVAWPAILLVAATAYVAILEPDRRASSGREAGIALAAHLPDGAEVWADEMIEARPEVLLYAVREAARQGRRVRVRWVKPEFKQGPPAVGTYLLLRQDDLQDEVRFYSRNIEVGALETLATGGVHKYTFILCRVGTAANQ